MAKVYELGGRPEYKRADFSDAVRAIYGGLDKAIAKPIKDSLRAYEQGKGGVADIRKAIEANPRGREYARAAIDASGRALSSIGNESSYDRASILEILRHELDL